MYHSGTWCSRANDHILWHMPDCHSSSPPHMLPVQAVLEFARWAFKSHEERAAEMRAQALIRAQVAASQRMAAVGQLPGAWAESR